MVVRGWHLLTIDRREVGNDHRLLYRHHYRYKYFNGSFFVNFQIESCVFFAVDHYHESLV